MTDQHPDPRMIALASVNNLCAVLSKYVSARVGVDATLAMAASMTSTATFEQLPLGRDAGALEVVGAIELERAQGAAHATFFASFAEGPKVIVLASKRGEPEIVRCAERGPNGRLGTWQPLGANWLSALKRSAAHA
jgi:hypothetical protein